jgi:hypothetical protein
MLCLASPPASTACAARRRNDIESSAPLRIAANCMPKLRAKLRAAEARSARTTGNIDSHGRLHGPIGPLRPARRRCLVLAMPRLLSARRDKVPRASPERRRFGTYRSGGARSCACARRARVSRPRTSKPRRGIQTPTLRRVPNLGPGRIGRMWTSHSLTNGAVVRLSVTCVAHFVMRRSIHTSWSRRNPLF